MRVKMAKRKERYERKEMRKRYLLVACTSSAALMNLCNRDEVAVRPRDARLVQVPHVRLGVVRDSAASQDRVRQTALQRRIPVHSSTGASAPGGSRRRQTSGGTLPWSAGRRLLPGAGAIQHRLLSPVPPGSGRRRGRRAD